MSDWKKLIYRNNLTDAELKQVPCMHRDIEKIITDYFYTTHGIILPGVKQSSTHNQQNYWINAYDFDQFMQQLYQLSSDMIHPSIFSKIANKFVTSEGNLFKLFLHQVPAKMALTGVGSVGNTLNHAMQVDVVFHSNNSFMISIEPLPYYQKITMGTYCHFVRGLVDSVFDHKNIPARKVRETFCSVDLKTLINKTYGKLNWKATEDKRYIYLNKKRLAEKITFPDKLATQHGNQVKKPIQAARILSDISHTGQLLLKQGEIYNAPYCCLEGHCPDEHDRRNNSSHLSVWEKELIAKKEKEMIIFDYEVQEPKITKKAQKVPVILISQSTATFSKLNLIFNSNKYAFNHYTFASFMHHKGKLSANLILLEIGEPIEDFIQICNLIKSMVANKKIPLATLYHKKHENYVTFIRMLMDLQEHILLTTSAKAMGTRIDNLLKNSNLDQDREQMYRAGQLMIWPNRHQVFIKDREVELRPKEFKILLALVRNKGMNYARQALIQAAFDDPNIVDDDSTIYTHIKNLRKKLGQYGSCIKTVPGIGYAFEV